MQEVFGARGQDEQEERACRLDRSRHALDGELKIIDRLVYVSGRVLDRAAHDAGLRGEPDHLGGGARLVRIAALEVCAHRKRGRKRDVGTVIQHHAPAHRTGPVAAAERVRETKASRCERLEAERGEDLGRAGVPRIRNDERARALVKRANARAFATEWWPFQYIRPMEEALLLARVQFGLNIAFHILFPTITIGLAWLLVVFRVRYERTRDPAWLGAYQLWVKVFALSFAMGVVSGITMSFQFGTNWPGYMNRVGNIAGPLLAYEVLTAFFSKPRSSA